MAFVPIFSNASDLCNNDVFNETILRPWFRSKGPTCMNFTSSELDLRRKYEILQHKQIGNSETRAQRYRRVATNTMNRRNQTFATQNLNRTPIFTNPNIKNLPQNGNSLILPACPPTITYTYGADVPGPAMPLTPVNLTIPLTRFNSPQRQYLGGSEKFPQWAWYPGANGFPVGHKGKR